MTVKKEMRRFYDHRNNHHEFVPGCDFCANRERDRAFHAGQRVTTFAPGEANIVCPHCGATGSVAVTDSKRKQGISGGKATAAVVTAGFSILATGLSRKVKVKELHCSHCDMTWTVRGLEGQ